MKRFVAVAVSVLIIGSVVSAQSADEFIQNAGQAFDQKQYAQLAALYERAFAVGSDDAESAYNAVRCYALIEGRDKHTTQIEIPETYELSNRRL